MGVIHIINGAQQYSEASAGGFVAKTEAEESESTIATRAAELVGADSFRESTFLNFVVLSSAMPLETKIGDSAIGPQREHPSQLQELDEKAPIPIQASPTDPMASGETFRWRKRLGTKAVTAIRRQIKNIHL
jgi:hypothetical protein